nr:peptide deformylase [Acinetobacter baumannii]
MDQELTLQDANYLNKEDKRTLALSSLGEAVETIFHGFPARIVQHEVDHLNGILFVERIS